MINLKCKICGKDFLVKNYRAKTALYCSLRCKSDDKEVIARIVKSGRETFEKNKALGLFRTAWNKGVKGLHLSPKSEFKKGSEPWNKNLKGIHLSVNSEFKKGIIPKNKLKIGDIQERVCKNGKVRKFIKVAEPNVWEQYSRFLWVKNGFELLDGHVIHHIDFNENNDVIENLEQLTRADHARIHALSRWK